MNDQVWWYATRAAGLMTWSTAVASVIVGLLLSTRTIKSRTGPWMLDLHRFLGGISVLFLVVHMATLPLDSFVDFGVRELFIPGESTWNTEAAAWGIIAAYALILVELTSLLRKHLSTSVWRTFHMLSIVTAIAGTYHAILGGTDVDNPLTWLVAGAGSAIVIALVAIRLKDSDRPSSPRVAKANDREALLQEMHARLENLPVAADAPRAELTTDGAALPRRAPSAPMPAAATVPTGPAPGAFDRTVVEPDTPAPPDPFAATGNPFTAPISHPSPEPVTPAVDDPFTPAPPSAPPPRLDDITGGRPVADPFGRGHAAVPEAPLEPPPVDPFTPAPPIQATPPPMNPFDASAESVAAPTDPFAAPSVEPFRSEPAADPFATPPHDDPFAGQPQADPFGNLPADAAPIAETTAPPAATETPIPPTAAPFLDPAELSGTPTDPFAATPTDGVSPFEPVSELPPPPMAPAEPFTQPDPVPSTAPTADPFATAAPTPPLDPFAAPPAPDPFAGPPVDPFATPPAPAPVSPEPSAPPPPPVPNAVDPQTGEPDEAAYTAWLVEWLAYAEKYGEETPDDPSRVL